MHKHKFKQDKANKCSEVCYVIVYSKQKHIQKKRKVFLLLFVNLQGKLIFNVIYRLVSSVANHASNYLLAYALRFAHSTHGGGLQTVSITNKVAFAHVGFYLVKKYWTVSKKLTITLRQGHYILCFCLLL